jgi:hypothetical protein
LTGSTEEIVRVISFKTVSVFDISQTEGAVLPNITPDQLQGEAARSFTSGSTNWPKTKGSRSRTMTYRARELKPTLTTTVTTCRVRS